MRPESDGRRSMADLIADTDWSTTPLGAMNAWPVQLQCLKSLMLASVQPMFVAWGFHRTLLYNDAYTTLLGRKHPQALGRSFFDVWPEVRDDVQPLFERVYAGEAVGMDDIRLMLDRGDAGAEEAHFAFSYTPVATDTGDIGGLFCACVETTAALLSQGLIARERARLVQMFDLSPSFIAILEGPEHRVTLANPGYLKLVGRGDVVGRTIAETLPDAVNQGYVELLDKVYTSGRAFTSTGAKYTVEAVRGGPVDEHFVDFVFQPITDGAGMVTGIFVEGSDVTLRVLAENALREREEQLQETNWGLEYKISDRTRRLLDNEAMIRTFFQHSTECHAVLVESGDSFRYEEINPATLKLYKKARAAVVGLTIDEVFGSAMAAEVKQHLAAALRTNAPHQYERVHDGAVVEAIATPVPYELHVARRVLVTARDVTERRRLEEQLRQSQKMEAIGQLTGGLAHDLNNMLTGITGSLELLQVRVAQGRSNDFDRYVSVAQGSARRAAALTHRLLAFARRQTLDAKPTDVNRLVLEMEDFIRRTVGPEIELHVVGAIGLWSTRVDPNQLENALLNVCINARDAMPNGGKLTIETANRWIDERGARERDLAPGQYISLCVSDTGTGMTPDVISRAFEPFFTTKPIGAGTGLGLSMAYGFARQSGGQVRIYSELAQGSVICLYLPRHHETGDVSRDAAAPPVFEAADAGETVLIVDDEPTVRMLSSEVLKDLGYVTIEAVDGVEGLKVLQSDRRIDLVVSDVGLPGGINGRQLADAGRALRPGLKVLFITGYAENAVLGHGHLQVGYEVLTKPFAMKTLASRVNTMLKRADV